MTVRGPASLFILIATVPCCTAITVRPGDRPFPLAARDTVTALPPTVISTASAAATELGLEIARSTAAEGFLETRWYNPQTGESRGSNDDPANLVRLRVWADLVTPAQTQVVVESVYRRGIDPSLPDRLDESVAAAGTPGDSLAQQLRLLIRERIGTASR